MRSQLGISLNAWRIEKFLEYFFWDLMPRNLVYDGSSVFEGVVSIVFHYRGLFIGFRVRHFIVKEARTSLLYFLEILRIFRIASISMSVNLII